MRPKCLSSFSCLYFSFTVQLFLFRENAAVSSASNPLYMNNEKDSKGAEKEEGEEEANEYELCQGSNTFGVFSDLTSDGIYESIDDCVKNPET